MINQAGVRPEDGIDTASRAARRKLHWRWLAVVVAASVISALLATIRANYSIVDRLNSQAASQSQQIPQQISSNLIPSGTVIYPELNRTHVLGKVNYDHSPPVGGNHSPVWLNCGIYDHPVANENAVHSLEHGSVWVTYLPDLPQAEVDTLRTLVKASYAGPQHYVILSPYPGQSTPVIASAWGYQLTLQTPTDPRLKAFINYFRRGPQTLEPSGKCTGGTGTPIG